MINKVTLIGHLGADPEMHQAHSGTNIAKLRVATNSRAKVDGEWTDKTEWHSVVAFGKTAENVGQYCRKGKLLYIEGRLETRKWQDKEGNDRYSTSVVANEIKFLSRDEGASNSNGRSRPRRNQQDHSNQSYNDDGKIPF